MSETSDIEDTYVVEIDGIHLYSVLLLTLIDTPRASLFFTKYRETLIHNSMGKRFFFSSHAQRENFIPIQDRLRFWVTNLKFYFIENVETIGVSIVIIAIIANSLAAQYFIE